ncbi:MAG: hypothetical protein RLZZ262_1051 [Bacteroidota bacterium]|jgi:uncharacterized membrane protein
MDKTKSVFAYVLSGVVVLITLIAVLAIWDILPWDFMVQYFGKTIKSFIVIAISAVVIYVIHSLLGSNQKTST